MKKNHKTKTLKNALIGYYTVNERILVIKLHTAPVLLNAIQVYAPTSTKEEINNFYEVLQDTIKDIPKREILITLGDFNAIMGNTNEDNHLPQVIGKYGLGKRNNRGDIFLDFCAENMNY